MSETKTVCETRVIRMYPDNKRTRDSFRSGHLVWCLGEALFINEQEVRELLPIEVLVPMLRIERDHEDKYKPITRAWASEDLIVRPGYVIVFELSSGLRTQLTRKGRVRRYMSTPVWFAESTGILFSSPKPLTKEDENDV